MFEIFELLQDRILERGLDRVRSETTRLGAKRRPGRDRARTARAIHEGMGVRS